jgi:hypothetical protein
MVYLCHQHSERKWQAKESVLRNSSLRRIPQPEWRNAHQVGQSAIGEHNPQQKADQNWTQKSCILSSIQTLNSFGPASSIPPDIFDARLNAQQCMFERIHCMWPRIFRQLHLRGYQTSTDNSNVGKRPKRLRPALPIPQFNE